MQPHYEKYIRLRHTGIPTAELRKGVNSQQVTQEVGKGNPLAMFRQQIASNEEEQNHHCSIIITPRAELQKGEGDAKTKTKQDRTEQNRTKNCNEFLRSCAEETRSVVTSEEKAAIALYQNLHSEKRRGKKEKRQREIWNQSIHMICSKPVPKTKTHL